MFYIIRNNPILFLLIVLAIISPPLFGVAVKAILYIIAGIVILIAILVFSIRSKIRRMQREMEEQMGRGTGQEQSFNQNSGGFFSGRRASKRQSDDDVKIYKQSGTGEKKVSENVGDYVDFEEVKEK